MKKLLLILAMVLLSQTATAQWTVKRFLEGVKNPATKDVYQMFFLGVLGWTGDRGRWSYECYET